MSSNSFWNPKAHLQVCLYANPDVKNLLHVDENLYDLIKNNREDLTPVIRALYNKLLAQEIRYSDEKMKSDDDEAQSIRKPNEILSGNKEGTCLDLALLFCGLCCGHKLLPIFVLLENHALVAVPLKLTFENRNNIERPKKLCLEEGPIFDGNILRELVDEHNYILIECTGFAKSKTISKDFPEGRERVDDLLDFERAIAAGRQQLDCRKFVYLVDIEIAHRLIRQHPYPVGNNNAGYKRLEILANVRKIADGIVEDQLKPEILERISRSRILDDCRKEILLGVEEKQQRIIPIIGSAGYGKSVILGNIYESLRDELVDSGKSWIALVRCDDIINELEEKFADELGEKASGYTESITEIAKILSNDGKTRGVLLVDTLDISLTHKLVPVLRILLSELLKYGTTIVFTCRKEDYEFYFEPYEESFRGFHHSVQPCEIKEFEDTDENPEVQTAVRSFFIDKLKVEDQEIVESSVREIIESSTRSPSLREITCNPFLLALLCELYFSKDEEHQQIPEELTVSQLYDKYWDRRVFRGRKTSQNIRLGDAMVKLCHKMAEAMYGKSVDNLHNFIYRDSLGLDNPDTLDKEAYETLISNGVLKSPDQRASRNRNKVTFLHQAFTEYAIARWLASTDSGEIAKKHLFDEIASSLNDDYKSYMYPVVRQLLTIEDIRTFCNICNGLDRNKSLTFRTIAFASLSRSEPEAGSVFYQLLPTALTKGKAYQNSLLRAGNSALKPHIEIVWKVILKLLKECDEELISNVSVRAGKLLGRFEKEAVSKHLEDALKIIDMRSLIRRKKSRELTSTNCCNSNKYLEAHALTEKVGNKTKDENTQQGQKRHLVANLIGEYSKTIKLFKRSVDINTLRILESYYFSPFCSSESRATIITLHLYCWLSEEIKHELDQVQSDFLMTITKQPTSKKLKEKNPASTLLRSQLPGLLESGNSCFGESWFSALHTRLPEKWNIIQARAVGLQAVQDTKLMELLLARLLDNKTSNENMTRYIVAIDEAICSGAGKSLASALLEIKIKTIQPDRVPTIFTLLTKLPGYLDEKYQIQLVKWILPIASQNIVKFINTIDRLAHNSPQLKQILGQLLVEQVIEQPTVSQQARNQIIKKLNYVPENIQDYLNRTIEINESRLALSKLYKSQVEEHGRNEYLSKLFELCLDNSENVSLEAARNILVLTKTNRARIELSALVPILLQSNIIDVCLKCLDSAGNIVKAGSYDLDSDICLICDALHNKISCENFNIIEWVQVIKSWYKLIEVYVSFDKKISLDLLDWTINITKLIIGKSENTLNQGIASSAFMTMKNIANLEDGTLMLKLGECTRALLRAVDMDSAGDKSFAIGLLDKISRFNEDFFSTIYKEDFFREGDRLPTQNMKVVVVAILHSHGKNADLLKEMLKDKRICEQVKNVIHQERGC